MFAGAWGARLRPCCLGLLLRDRCLAGLCSSLERLRVLQCSLALLVLQNAPDVRLGVEAVLLQEAAVRPGHVVQAVKGAWLKCGVAWLQQLQQLLGLRLRACTALRLWAEILLH